MASEVLNQSNKLNFDHFKEQPRLTISIENRMAILAANEHFLLCDSTNGLLLIDEQGNEKISIPIRFSAQAGCWSSHLNQFLISDGSGENLYALDINTQQLHAVKKIIEGVRSCTCYEETFLCAIGPRGEKIEKYNLSNWQLEGTFSIRDVAQIKFNSDGTHVGIILDDPEDVVWSAFSFALYNPQDMSLLQKSTYIDAGHYCCLIPLPLNGQFEYLATIYTENYIYLLDSNGQLKETLADKHVKKVISAAIINSKIFSPSPSHSPDIHKME
ncbi:unnamed protein product [Adineta ricciae]|uniref:Uncharacterized protein n=1 Tax=Adineta ricciae TaxID=249248 RepID=A0A814LPG5_ADIRI|nr:unnamed protein product [Adineta ricciae]CAF1461127.1 unnamed protein product [Adineta ricciae]